MENISYVAVEMSRSEKYPELRFGESSRVYVGDDWKFSIQVLDKYTMMVYVVMFTSLHPANVVGFHVLTPSLCGTLTAMSQLTAPPF